MLDELKIVADRRGPQDYGSQPNTTTSATSTEHELPTLVTTPSSISFIATEGSSSSNGGDAVGATTGEGREQERNQQQREQQQLQILARQIEYYLSTENLATDTYLQTLRQLNDGCVPVSILANFAKVTAILTPPAPPGTTQNKGKPAAAAVVLLQEEEARIHAVLQAVNEYTDRLKIHSIDTATGKITTDETPSSALTILVVGVPQPLSSTTTTTSLTRVSSSASMPLPETSTIILRDVDPVVTEKEVRGLLEGLQHCAPVVRVVADVGNCWYVLRWVVKTYHSCTQGRHWYLLETIADCFVPHVSTGIRFLTFDTCDRTEMMGIMMQLRQMTFPSTGQYVMARLKASSVTVAPVDVYTTLPTDEQSVPNTSVGTQKKSRKRRKKRPKKKSNKAENKATGSGNSNTNSDMQKSASFAVAEEPVLRFTNDHFPSLQNDKVEWETEPVNVRGSQGIEDDDSSEDSSTKNGEEGEEPKPAKALSDAASTATTSSSTNTTLSASGFELTANGIKGGYAAAVLKTSSAPALREVPSLANSREASAALSSNSAVSSKADADDIPAPLTSVTASAAQPWGGGSESFVEVVRKQKS